MGDDPIDAEHLCGADVVGFVAAMRGRFSPRSMKAVGTALGSFFRFLRVVGLSEEHLEAALHTSSCLDDEQLGQVLASLDAPGPCRRRNRAIVICLATLGLRPGEVANLGLEDLDWRSGTLMLKTRKIRVGAVVPLPREAGRAIVAYLREERSETSERSGLSNIVGPDAVNPCRAAPSRRSSPAPSGALASRLRWPAPTCSATRWRRS
jgi:site-specific recombinase XerD